MDAAVKSRRVAARRSRVVEGILDAYATVRADLVVRDCSLIKQLDEVRPRDVQ